MRWLFRNRCKYGRLRKSVRGRTDPALESFMYLFIYFYFFGHFQSCCGRPHECAAFLRSPSKVVIINSVLIPLLQHFGLNKENPTPTPPTVPPRPTSLRQPRRCDAASATGLQVEFLLPQYFVRTCWSRSCSAASVSRGGGGGGGGDSPRGDSAARCHRLFPPPTLRDLDLVLAEGAESERGRDRLALPLGRRLQPGCSSSSSRESSRLLCL